MDQQQYINKLEGNHYNGNNMIRRPSFLRSPPSIQLTTYTAHAHSNNITKKDNTNEDSSTERKPSIYTNNSQQINSISSTTTAVSRTQHKIMLQRQSFLADDKNYLDHPDNMRRLTKELERVNREYRCVKQFQDPLALSIQRVLLLQQQQQAASNNNSSPPPPSHYLLYSPTISFIASSYSSTNSSSQQFLLLLSPTTTRLQRRASSNTVHDYLLNFKEERRHSFSFYNSNNNSAMSSPGFIGRIFGVGGSSSTTTMHHSPLSLSQLKRHPHVA